MFFSLTGILPVKTMVGLGKYATYIKSGFVCVHAYVCVQSNSRTAKYIWKYAQK
jgi:hypothetical protein